MKRYSYKALTPSGDVISGVIEADSDADVRKQIEARGMMAVEMEAESGLAGVSQINWRHWIRSRPKDRDVTEFLQQLAALLQASIRLDHALELLSHQELSGLMAERVQDIRRAILSGESLSAAFARHTELFPDSMRALITLAEQSGSLAEAIVSIAIERERAEKLKQKAIDALTYPAFLLCAVTAALTFFITFVLPQFRPIIVDLGQKADPFLMALLDFSAFLERNRNETIGLVVVAIMSLVALLKNKPRRHAIAGWFLKAPGLRALDRDYRTARFCRNFGHLVERGISLHDAIDLAGKTIATPSTLSRFQVARDEVRQGRRIFDSLERINILSPVALRMLRIGEETGRMPMIALKAADMFEIRVERQMEKLVGLIGPIAIILVSLIVGGLIISVMNALMSINQMVG